MQVSYTLEDGTPVSANKVVLASNGYLYGYISESSQARLVKINPNTFVVQLLSSVSAVGMSLGEATNGKLFWLGFNRLLT